MDISEQMQFIKNHKRCNIIGIITNIVLMIICLMNFILFLLLYLALRKVGTDIQDSFMIANRAINRIGDNMFVLNTELVDMITLTHNITEIIVPILNRGVYSLESLSLSMTSLVPIGYTIHNTINNSISDLVRTIITLRTDMINLSENISLIFRQLMNNLNILDLMSDSIDVVIEDIIKNIGNEYSVKLSMIIDKINEIDVYVRKINNKLN